MVNMSKWEKLVVWYLIIRGILYKLGRQIMLMTSCILKDSIIIKTHKWRSEALHDNLEVILQINSQCVSSRDAPFIVLGLTPGRQTDSQSCKKSFNEKINPATKWTKNECQKSMPCMLFVALLCSESVPSKWTKTGVCIVYI